MDLQDFNVDTLYCEDLAATPIEQLLLEAEVQYANGSDRAESLLLKAFQLAPESLTVLIGLYRYYFYQHRHDEALFIAMQLLDCVAPRIHFPAAWRNLRDIHLAQGVMISFSFVRFYLLALKAAGSLQLQLGQHQEGLDMLRKVITMDSADRLGTRHLLNTLERVSAEIIPFPIPATKEIQA